MKISPEAIKPIPLQSARVSSVDATAATEPLVGGHAAEYSNLEPASSTRRENVADFTCTGTPSLAGF